MLRKSFAHLLKYIKPNISHNKFFDLTSQFSYGNRMLGSCPMSNSIQYISHKVNPLPKRLGRQLDSKGEIFTTRRFFSSTVNTKNIEKMQEIKKLEEFIKIIRTKSIPKLKLSEKLSFHAENLAVYFNYLIDYKKGLTDTPDRVSLLKMLYNLTNLFESEVLSLSSPPKEAIEDIRRAIQYCVSDKELSELSKSHYREFKMQNFHIRQS